MHAQSLASSVRGAAGHSSREVLRPELRVLGCPYLPGTLSPARKTNTAI